MLLRTLIGWPTNRKRALYSFASFINICKDHFPYILNKTPAWRIKKAGWSFWLLLCLPFMAGTKSWSLRTHLCTMASLSSRCPGDLRKWKILLLMLCLPVVSGHGWRCGSWELGTKIRARSGGGRAPVLQGEVRLGERGDRKSLLLAYRGNEEACPSGLCMGEISLRNQSLGPLLPIGSALKLSLLLWPQSWFQAEAINDSSETSKIKY